MYMNTLESTIYAKAYVKVLIFNLRTNEKMVSKGLVRNMYELESPLIKNSSFC